MHNEIDVNHKNELGQSLLQEAIAAENYEVAGALVDVNIDFDNVDHKGQAALHYLSERDEVDLIKVLLAKGVDASIFDKFGNQALWTAVFYARGRYNIVRELVKYNADPLNKNNAGRSPLDFSKQIGDSVLVMELQQLTHK